MLRVLEPKENKIPRVWMGSKINTRQGTQNKKKKTEGRSHSQAKGQSTIYMICRVYINYKKTKTEAKLASSSKFHYSETTS